MSGDRKRYCVFGCQALFTSGVPVHRFPNPSNRREIYEKWVNAVGDKLEERIPEKVYANKRVCDHHFLHNDKKDRNRLTETAIPSIQLFCVQQSFTSFVNMDHSYSRRNFRPPPDRLTFSSGSSVFDKGSTSTIEKENTEDSSTKAGSLSSNQQNEYDESNDQIHDLTDADDNLCTMDIPQDDFGAIEAIEDITDNSYMNDDDVEFKYEVRLNDQETLKHSEFKCNICRGEIVGYRYVCMQCVDWDMCATCEAKGEHPEHYVLRLPKPKPYAECEPAIAAIREQIQNLLLLSKEIKSEVYYEAETNVDEITKEFDPHLTDPFSTINDRDVPELTDISINQSKQPVDAHCGAMNSPKHLQSVRPRNIRILGSLGIETCEMQNKTDSNIADLNSTDNEKCQTPTAPDSRLANTRTVRPRVRMILKTTTPDNVKCQTPITAPNSRLANTKTVRPGERMVLRTTKTGTGVKRICIMPAEL